VRLTATGTGRLCIGKFQPNAEGGCFS
jgi:hypothetical protein